MSNIPEDDVLDNIPKARIVRRTSDRVILRCVYCGGAHAHGVLPGEQVLARVSHCSTTALEKAGRDRGGIYVAVNADGSLA